MIPENMRWVLDNIYTDIAEFMDEPLDAVMAKCQHGAQRVYKLWKNFGNPSNEKERDDFYACSTAHLYEGANWHNDPNARIQRFKIAEMCEGRVLDYGCGIATEAFYAALMGHDVDLYDIGGIAYFLKWRIKKYGLKNIRVVNETELNEFIIERICGQIPIYKTYNTLISIDVLEHVNKPQECLENFAMFIGYEGLLLIEAPFHELEPKGHLVENAHLDLKYMIEKVGIKRWRTNLIR